MSDCTETKITVYGNLTVCELFGVILACVWRLMLGRLNPVFLCSEGIIFWTMHIFDGLIPI